MRPGARGTRMLFPQLTFRRRSFAVVAADGRRRPTSQSTVIKQWLVGPSDRVFEAARPWQTAFCGQQLNKIDWAAAPGTFVSMQLALLLLATDNADNADQQSLLPGGKIRTRHRIRSA